jgi:hypothetical protein
LVFNIISITFETINQLNNKIMKKTFLNLRNLGLVVVAAAAMTVVSCGGPTPEEEAAAQAEAEAMVNDMFGGLEEAMDGATAEMEVAADEVVEEVHEHAEGEAAH